MLARPSKPHVDWLSPLPALSGALVLGALLGALVVVGSPPLAAAALLGAALVLVVLRAPALGLYGLVVVALLLPFAVIPARVGGQLTLLEAVLGLTMTATTLRALTRKESPRPEGVSALLFGVLFLALLSFVLSVPYTGSLPEVGRKFVKLALVILVLPLSLRLLRDPRHVDGLLLALMICGGLEAAITVALYWAPRETTIRLLSGLGPLGYPTGDDVLRFLPGENDTYSDILRATGTSIDPNVLGGELMLVSALLLAQLFAPRPLLPRWVVLPAAAMSVLAMLLSHSRSSWIGLAVGLLGLAIVRYRRLWLGIAMGALAVALLPAGRTLYARVLSGFAGQDKAASMRLDEYRNALAIVQQHPVFGIGFGAAPAIDLAPGVSSIYLTVAETMGVPALALFLIALAWIVVDGWRALLEPLQPRVEGNLASLQTALIAALASGLFDHYFASTAFPHMIALFWLVCGLIRSVTVQAGAERSGPASGRDPTVTVSKAPVTCV